MVVCRELVRTVASGGKCGIVTRWQMVGIGDHHGVDGMDGMVAEPRPNG